MEENESQKLELCLACPTDSRQTRDQAKPSLHVTSLDDAECLRSKELLSTPSSHTSSGSKSTRNIPRRHTVGGPRSSKEILGMQTSEMDRKREAFLEHLKQKYPHHATAIMGHQERLRDQRAYTEKGVKASFIQINPSLDVPPEDPFLLLIICHKSEVQSWPGNSGIWAGVAKVTMEIHDVMLDRACQGS
ncbi:sickle tail protein [Turdus rufiventris]|nr:sickle tail protein [Turdus rufiventris]